MAHSRHSEDGMLGNDISNKNGRDELKMRKVRIEPWDGKREIRKVPHVHIAAGVANFGFEWLSSQRKKGVASYVIPTIRGEEVSAGTVRMLTIGPGTRLRCRPLSWEGTNFNTTHDYGIDVPGFSGSRSQGAASGMGMANAEEQPGSWASSPGDPRAAGGF